MAGYCSAGTEPPVGEEFGNWEGDVEPVAVGDSTGAKPNGIGFTPLRALSAVGDAGRGAGVSMKLVRGLDC